MARRSAGSWERPGTGCRHDDEAVVDDSPYPSRYGRNSWIRNKLGGKGYAAHAVTLAGSFLVKDFVALHMTWGAINELTTLTAYHRLIARTHHPVLKDMLERIIKDERRHFAFYRAQARIRLARSPRPRRMVRWAVDHVWAVVGTGVRPQSETDHVVTMLFGGADGLRATREMQDVVRALPGMRGTRFLERARAEALQRRHAAAARSSAVRTLPSPPGERPSAMPFAALRSG